MNIPRLLPGKLLYASLIVLLVSALAAAQQNRGTLRGAITDELGAVIVGANVTLTDANGVQKKTTTNAEGIYTYAGLAPGKYSLAANAPGFAPAENKEVDVTGGRQTADLTLIGKRVENTAKTQWSISGEYRLTPVLPGLAITAGAFYTGARAINPQNSLFVPGYTLFDLGGSYTFKLAGTEMVARVYSQNLTNKRYFASTSSNFIAFGAPSVVKFSLSMKLF